MMKLSKSLKQFEDQARQHDSYWVERAKLDFSIQLERLRRAKGMTCVALAEKFGRSGAYISKIFRGDSNLTIESMVKLARATGGRLTITVADEKAVSPVRPYRANRLPGRHGDRLHRSGAVRSAR